MFLQQPFRFSGRAGRIAVAALLTLVAACATPPEDPVERQAFYEANDPIEPLNRYVYDVNTAVDDVALMPLSTMYREGVPEPFRNGIKNFLQNLSMPVTILNSALQGDWDNTVDSTVSFFINTTAGLGGIFDIPGNFDEEPRREDFGQTLAVWGMDEGAFIELPLIGPSNVRDTVGLGVDILTDPLTYLLTPGWSYARAGAEGVNKRSELGEEYDTMRDTSIDFYATVRSLYRQDRDAAIANGDADMPLFDDDD
jgi:phospholipid-binding lipoprotein MlaA